MRIQRNQEKRCHRLQIGVESRRMAMRMLLYWSLMVGITVDITTAIELIDIAQYECPYNNFCTKDKRLELPMDSGRSCCGTCFCTDDCIELNKCCPDFTPPSTTQFQRSDIPMPTCKSTSYVKESLFFFLIYDTCPMGYSNLKVVEKCTGQTPLNFDEFAMVWSPSAERIYQNRFCAECHEAGETINWQMIMKDCSSYNGTESIDQILNMIEDESECEVYFVPPEDSNYAPLSKLECANVTSLYSVCNSSGHWATYDPYLETGCQQEYVASPYHIYDDYLKWIAYRNVFCYLCNVEVPRESKVLCLHEYDFGSYAGRKGIFSKSMIVLFNPEFLRSAVSSSVCNIDEILEPINSKCLHLHCMEYEIARNGECIPKYSLADGLPVKVTMLASPVMKHVLQLRTVEEQLYFSYVFIQQIIDEMRLLEGKGDVHCGLCQCNIQFQFENGSLYIENIFVKIVYRTRIGCNTRYILETFIQFVRRGNLHINTDPFNQTFLLFLAKSEPEQTNASFETYSSRNCFADSSEQYSDPLLCPHILLTKADFNSAVAKGIVSIETNTESSFQDVYRKTEAGVQVCLANYLEGSKIFIAMSKIDHSSTLVKVSLGTIGMSITCITTTAIVSAVFKDLRRFPNSLIIVASINLLLAQGVYLLGVTHMDHVEVCTALGIASQYLWLAYLLTLNAYMIISNYMMKTASSVPPSVKSKSLFYMFLYIYGAPMLPIGAIAVLSIVRGSNNGESSTPCYVEAVLKYVYLLAFPIALLVVVNCMFFYLAVRSASASRTSSNFEIKYPLVYLTLSFLFGATWLSGYVADLTRNPFLEYLCIVLQGGQGLLIFVCFMCNSQMYDRFRQALSPFG